MSEGALCEAEPDVEPLQFVHQLEAALVAGDPAEKDYHIRQALQLFVATECQ